MKRLLRKAARGYTIVELLMSLTVLAFGVSGVMAMQKVTISNNREAKNLALATRIAEAWMDELVTDGMLWTLDNTGTSTLNNTVWLKATTTGNTGTWAVPDWSATRSFGPGFGALGQPSNHDASTDLQHFCTHVRLAFLKSETLPTKGNGVIRAQVRVFYRRESPGVTSVPTGKICDIKPPLFDANINALSVVYLTTAIRQQPPGKTSQ